MKREDFIVGKIYTHQQYMELSILEMLMSRSEHNDKTDPKVGAVLVDTEGKLVASAHRGELRSGDHAEYTIFSKKLRSMDVTGYTLYTTLEPCVERNHPKRGCSFHTIDARVGKVYIGHKDPDPTVAGNGIRLLTNAKIVIDYYDKEYNEQIAQANVAFFEEALKRAKDISKREINAPIDPFENELANFTLADMSEEAQHELINKMDLQYKFASDSYNSFLSKLGLISVSEKSKSARPTGLGLLLLGKNPALHFPQSRIKFTIRRKEQPPIIKDFDGPLVLIPKKIEEYLQIVFPKQISRLSFHRTEDYGVPYRALLEVIMNALVHRDYTIEGARIMIDVDEEKITVSSPGIPIAGIEKFQSFSVASISRNPKIAYIFSEMGLVEERGFGMEELAQLEKQGYRRPDFRLDDNTLLTTIYRGVPMNTVVPESHLPGYLELQQHRILTTSKYMELAGVSESTARRRLRELAEAGLAHKIGKGPSTEYTLAD